MSIVTPVVYFRLYRDEDGRPSREHDLAFQWALRWRPEGPDNREPLDNALDEVIDQGRSILNRLRGGDDISHLHLSKALAYLELARSHYATAEWEPYRGRNNEAAEDLRTLHQLLVAP